MVAGGQAFKASTDDFVKPFMIPNAFSDNVKFLSFSELRELRNEPERIDRIDKDKRTLAMTLAGRETIDAIDQSLRATGSAKFIDPYGQRFTLRGAALRPTFKEGLPGKRERDPCVFQVIRPPSESQVVVKTTATDGKMYDHVAENGFIRIPATPDPERGSAMITIQLMKVVSAPIGPDGEVESPGDVPAGRGEVAERPLSDLALVGDGSLVLLGRGTNEVETLARQRMLKKRADEPVVLPVLNKLRDDVRLLLNEVLSKEQERYAMSVACLVMVLVGSVMAMRLRDALPLMVYMWAFFPALATVLAISGGQQLTHGNGIIGLPVLWAGVAALSVLAVAEFIRLCKH
jgi:hypothetical protein